MTNKTPSPVPGEPNKVQYISSSGDCPFCAMPGMVCNSTDDCPHYDPAASPASPPSDEKLKEAGWFPLSDMQAVQRMKEAAEAREEKLREALREVLEDNLRLRTHIADTHNRIRHTMFDEIHTAISKASSDLSGINIIKASVEVDTRARKALGEQP